MDWKTYFLNGVWYALRTYPPYFCFEAETEIDANATAERAVKFFENSSRK